MLLLLGGGWKQKDKVPQVCMQILKWCIAMHIINGFESLHEFIEARKSCLGPVSVMGSLKALLIWRCRGWLGQRWACLLWYTSWFLDITYLQSDSGCWCVRTLHPADVYGGAVWVGWWDWVQFDLVKTIVWCSPVWLSFTAPRLNCHVSVCESSGFVLSALTAAVLKSGWLCCWV